MRGVPQLTSHLHSSVEGPLILPSWPSPPFGSGSPFCCRKENPFQGPRVGSCLTLRNELSEETHVLTKQETSLGGAPGWRAGG